MGGGGGWGGGDAKTSKPQTTTATAGTGLPAQLPSGEQISAIVSECIKSIGEHGLGGTGGCKCGNGAREVDAEGITALWAARQVSGAIEFSSHSTMVNGWASTITMSPRYAVSTPQNAFPLNEPTVRGR